MTRVPGGTWPTSAKVEINDGETVDLGSMTPIGALTKLGGDGWELVGAPEVQNAVLPVKDSDGVSLDRAFWVERRFWFKRPGQP